MKTKIYIIFAILLGVLIHDFLIHFIESNRKLALSVQLIQTEEGRDFGANFNMDQLFFNEEGYLQRAEESDIGLLISSGQRLAGFMGFFMELDEDGKQVPGRTLENFGSINRNDTLLIQNFSLEDRIGFGYTFPARWRFIHLVQRPIHKVGFVYLDVYQNEMGQEVVQLVEMALRNDDL